MSEKGQNMLSEQDQERVAKASQTASLMVGDLRDIVRADDPLLAELGMDLLKQAVQIEVRMKRISTLAKDREDVAGGRGG